MKLWINICNLTDASYIKKIPDIPNDELDNCLHCNIPRILDASHGCMICPKWL